MEESIPATYYSSVIEENKEKMFGGTGGDIQILSYPHLILFRVYTRMLCSDGRSWRFGWSQTVDLNAWIYPMDNDKQLRLLKSVGSITGMSL